MFKTLLMKGLACLIAVAVLSRAVPADGNELGQRIPEMAISLESVTDFKMGGRASVKKVWRLWRSEAEVETYEAGSRDGDVWRRDFAGEISYLRVLHPERVQVDFTIGDLRANGTRPDWQRVSCVVSPELLGTVLKKSGDTEDFNGIEVERFEGEISGQKWSVLWSGKDQLAWQVRVEDDKAARTVTVREKHPLNAAPWPRMNRAEYQEIEFTELGDHDTNPKFVRLMKRVGISCGHRNCGATCVLPSALP